jgi:hypothetical protein
MRSGRTAGGAVVGGAAGYAWLHRLGRTSGSTRAERSASLPGDTLVPDPHVVTDHAATIAAHLVLHSRSHLPPHFRDRCHAGIDWSWAFVLRDVGDERTRLQVRTRVRLAPGWVAAGYWAALVPADHIMATQMLHGLKNRAEGHYLGDDPRGLRRVRDTVTALGLMAVSPLVRPWHLRWGATAAETRAPMPGDDILTNQTRPETSDDRPLIRVGLVDGPG